MNGKTLAVLVMILATLGTAVQAGGTKKEQEKFLGTWSMVSAEKEGKQAPKEVLKTFRITFAADGIVNFKIQGKGHDGKFKIDPAKKPMEIDFVMDGKNMRGIYAFEGKNLKVCVAHEDANRPSAFATEAGSKTFLMILKLEAK